MDTMAALGTQGSCQARTGAPSPGTQAGLGRAGSSWWPHSEWDFQANGSLAPSQGSQEKEPPTTSPTEPRIHGNVLFSAANRAFKLKASFC